MGISRLVMEFVAGDFASATIKRIAGEARNLGDAGKKAAADLEEAGERIAKGIKAAGIARELKAALVDPGLKAAADMDAAMRRLTVNLDSAPAAEIARQLEIARKTADEIAVATPFSSMQVLDESITELKKAGFKTEDILGSRGGAAAAASLATAEGTDIRTANAAIGVLAAKFDLAGDKLYEGADKLVRYSSASSASVSSLSEGLGQVTGAKGLISDDDTLAMLSLLDLQGRSGSAGGTALSAFLRELPEVDAKSKGKLDLYDDKTGTFRGLDESVKQLRTYFGGMNQQERSLTATKLFGDEGKSALEAILATGDKGLESVRANAGGAQGLEARMAVLAAGTNAQMEALGGTKDSTMARLFQPLLDPVSAMAGKANELVAGIGDAAAKDPRIAQGVSGAAAGATGAAALYAAYQLSMGAGKGLRGLGTLAGLPGGSLAAGVAAGKVAEAAGIQPVFVTNWPAGMGAPGLPGAAAAGGGAMGALGKAGLLGTALAGGWAVGSAINENLIQGTKGQDMIEGYMAAFMLNTPMRMLYSDEDKEGLRKQRGAGWDALKESLGLSVTVNVDADGKATVATEGVENVDVATRRNGAP